MQHSATKPAAAVTVNEAAARLSICRRTVYAAIARGELRAFKVGRATRITVASVEALLAGGTAKLPDGR